jgi:transcriptional regulator with XRE-family HTH domain
MVGSLTLREAIKKGRKNLGINQGSLGALVGCSRSLIAGLEGGTLPQKGTLRKIAQEFKELDRLALLATAEARAILGGDDGDLGGPEDDDSGDMISNFMKLRRSGDVDLSGTWNAMWLTTANELENRNREVINVRKRWNGTWQLSNEAISDDNPDGGYLWIARMELFDNKHLLGYYCARERAVLAKGTLCLELQPNGREIVGVWDGLNFDTMWATGLVALTRSTGSQNPGVVLDRFIRNRPKMPY